MRVRAHWDTTCGPTQVWPYRFEDNAAAARHSAGERYLLVCSRLRNLRAVFEPFLDLGHRAPHVGDRKAVGGRDGRYAQPRDQVIEPIAIGVHVGELGPEQGEVREYR